MYSISNLDSLVLMGLIQVYSVQLKNTKKILEYLFYISKGLLV